MLFGIRFIMTLWNLRFINKIYFLIFSAFIDFVLDFNKKIEYKTTVTIKYKLSTVTLNTKNDLSDSDLDCVLDKPHSQGELLSSHI